MAGNAPLGTFSARIKTARALGLITEDERHDLDILRDLRNAFAHEVGANFAERSVRDQCRSLKLSADEPDALPRDNFTTAAFALMIELAERTSQITEKRCQPLLRSAKKWTRAEDEKAEAEFVAERKPKRHND